MSDDPFGDVFAGNGASGSGLDPHENSPVIMIPVEFDRQGLRGDDGEWVATIDANIVSFANPDAPAMDDGVRIFAGRIVTALKNHAVFNMKNPEGDPNTNFPKMTVGIIKKGQRSGKKNPPWLMEPIEDKELLSKMGVWARANLKVKASDPFAPSK